MDYQHKKTRLTRLEEKRSVKQAIFFGFLTLLLIALFFFLGIPAMVKLATFLGDLKSATQKAEVEDTFPPAPPVLDTPPEATISSQITITGYSEEGCTVLLILNGSSGPEILAGKDGRFILSDVQLIQGENSLKALAKDPTGNESQISQQYTIIFDNEKPSLEITSPEENKTFYGKEKEILVSGQTDSNIQVFINDHLSISDSSGKFQTNFSLKEGENTITIKAKDKAGNETQKEIKVIYYP